MNHVKVISDLCAIIDRQNVIIQDQAMELAQCDALNRAEEIDNLHKKYADAMGAAPNNNEEVTAT